MYSKKIFNPENKESVIKMLYLTDCNLTKTERLYFLTERSFFYYEITYSAVHKKGNFNLDKRKLLTGFKDSDQGKFVDFIS
jgi:hypothetical protein